MESGGYFSFPACSDRPEPRRPRLRAWSGLRRYPFVFHHTGGQEKALLWFYGLTRSECRRRRRRSARSRRLDAMTAHSGRTPRVPASQPASQPAGQRSPSLVANRPERCTPAPPPLRPHLLFLKPSASCHQVSLATDSAATALIAAS